MEDILLVYPFSPVSDYPPSPSHKTSALYTEGRRGQRSQD